MNSSAAIYLNTIFRLSATLMNPATSEQRRGIVDKIYDQASKLMQYDDQAFDIADDVLFIESEALEMSMLDEPRAQYNKLLSIVEKLNTIRNTFEFTSGLRYYELEEEKVYS